MRPLTLRRGTSSRVFDRCFAAIFDAFSRRRGLVVGLTIIATVGAGIGLKSISLDNNIELMLPGDARISRAMRFLRESHFTDNVVISLGLESGDHSLTELLEASGKLEGELGPPWVTQVTSGVAGTDVQKEMASVLKHVPELLDAEALARIDEQITPEGVKACLRRNYRQMVTPASAFMVPLVRADPLGISSGILRSLRELSSSLGYTVELKNGYFVSRDAAHAMLVVETPVRVADASGARQLVGYLRDKLEELPEWVSADIVGGHLHTISNEDVIKRDIWLALSVATVAFVLVFVLLFRDIRAVMLFLIPVVSVLVSINLSSLVLSRLSYFIVGMGGVVAGIAVDYGIHVYMAVRSENGRPEAVKLVAKPVVTGALTTVGVFAAFFFSSAQGYHQLALFSILSVMLCLACSLFILPHFLSGAPRVEPHGTSRQSSARGMGDHGSIIIACWVLVLIGAGISVRDLRFSSDIMEFDGSEPYVLDAETEFHRVWGGEDQPAVLVVPGRDLDGALRRNQAVYREAVAVVGEAEFSSLSAIWPPREERAANGARWDEFWKRGREAELKRLLREHSGDYNFAADAFSPFFDNLYVGGRPTAELEDRGPFARLQERFVQKRQDGYQVLSFFPDHEEIVSELTAIGERHPGTFLVSRNALERGLAGAVFSEIVYLSAIAALLIPILAWALLADVRLTVLALVPVVTGLMVVLGTIAVWGLSVSAPNVISAMVVVGLCVDYGIFMVYACHYQLRTGTRMAVTLSAVTTLIGTGVLLFARHPILFSIGVTMVAGVLGGYVSSMLVVPVLYRRFVAAGSGPR
jgi:predicted RND superfamily exporter protein